MIADIHLHSEISFDSNEKPENYIEAANVANVQVLGFSEHYDYDALIDGADITVADIPKYVDEINSLKRKYQKVEILCGIEFGYRDFAVEHYRQLIERYDFDYVINSVHTLPDRGDCFHERFFEGRPLKESYNDYFNAVLKSVKADFDYQIIGHLGYVSRYRKGDEAHIRYSDFCGIIDEILKEIIARDKCLEINTSTGYTAGLSLPDCDVIKRYLELGGKKLSFGSDAHKAKDYLRKCTQALEFLKRAGVKQLFYYKKRQAIAYDL